jgi:hypothetical protein
MKVATTNSKPKSHPRFHEEYRNLAIPFAAGSGLSLETALEENARAASGSLN